MVNPGMSISNFGLSFIRGRESLRLTVYDDIDGHPTIGYGHLLTGDVSPDLTWDINKALSELAIDTQIASNAINTHVEVPLSQPQFDALSSFVFNIGTGHFERSTLLKLLNNKSYAAAGVQILVWDKQPKLRDRRLMEYGLWIYGTT